MKDSPRSPPSLSEDLDLETPEVMPPKLKKRRKNLKRKPTSPWEDFSLTKSLFKALISVLIITH